MQHQQYFNIQGILNVDCNNYLLDTLNSVISNPNMINLRNSILEKETKTEEEEKNKEIYVGILNELIQSNPNYESDIF